MARQPIDGGGWFETDSATTYDEDTHWDGSNHISCATGSQWDHETLYCTRKGVYIVHCSSQWQGSLDRWRRITESDAAEWLVANGHAGHTPALEAACDALEV